MGTGNSLSWHIVAIITLLVLTWEKEILCYGIIKIQDSVWQLSFSSSQYGNDKLHIMASSSFIGRIVSLVDLSKPPVSNPPCPNMGKGSFISWRHQILSGLWYLCLSCVRHLLIKTGMHCSPGWLLHYSYSQGGFLVAFSLSDCRQIFAGAAICHQCGSNPLLWG